jgi:transcriptional regulator with XRE-family HTH domain
MNIGNRIRQLREANNYSQNCLAEMAGISQTHLRRVELGSADITVGHLQLICDALGISLKEFFDVDAGQDEVSAIIATLTPKQKSLLLEFLKSL